MERSQWACIWECTPPHLLVMIYMRTSNVHMLTFQHVLHPHCLDGADRISSFRSLGACS